MTDIACPRILISGLQDNPGKVLIAMGLIQELRKRGVSVSCCVTGSNITQSLVFKRISGRYVRSLDDQVLSSSQTVLSLAGAALGSDIVVIVGEKGLFDGSEHGSLLGTNADLASNTDTPTLLVLDVTHIDASVVALLKGAQELASGFSVVSTILNRVSKDKRGKRDYYQSAFDSYGLEAPIGYVPEEDPPIKVPPRGLSETVNQTLLPTQFFTSAGNLINEYVDVNKIIEVAQNASPISLDIEDFAISPRKTKIAVTDDSCFGIIYQDNLDLLRFYGAEIITFSPLADSSIPRDIGALYITGGFIDEYGEQLSENISMAASIREFAENGGVLYSEGSGTAYLCKEFSSGEPRSRFTGVGIIPAIADRTQPEVDYVDAVTIEETVFGMPGLILKGITNSQWKINDEEAMIKGLRISRDNASTLHEGYSPLAQVIATTALFHFGSNPEIAKNIADAAEITCPLSQ